MTLKLVCVFATFKFKISIGLNVQACLKHFGFENCLSSIFYPVNASTTFYQKAFFII